MCHAVNAMLTTALRPTHWRYISLNPVNRAKSSLRMFQTQSAKANLSHEERTATEPRDKDLHSVILDKVKQVNDYIRTFMFTIPDKKGIKFLPGQWLDVHVPGLEKAGGFTITSAPRYAVPSSAEPHRILFLELAIQKSPDNPPAAWLWQPTDSIVGKELAVRVGGSFVWPPPSVDMEGVKRVVLIAGGVGINPLMAVLSHIRHEDPSFHVRLMYATKLPSKNPDRAEILFLPQILDLMIGPSTDGKSELNLFFSGVMDGSAILPDDKFVCSFNDPSEGENNWYVGASAGRIGKVHLDSTARTPEEQQTTVYYVCGPPEMTDNTVQYLHEGVGIPKDHVLCEKWW